jgi:hypothetical protein
MHHDSLDELEEVKDAIVENTKESLLLKFHGTYGGERTENQGRGHGEKASCEESTLSGKAYSSI